MKFTSSLTGKLLIFFISYFALFGIYQGYLHYYNEVLGEVDPLTQMVADTSNYLLQKNGLDAMGVVPEGAPYVYNYIDGKYATIVNEGCNGVSIAIIMVAFLAAFPQGWKKTLSYMVVVLTVFFGINILRVTVLSYMYRFKPDQYEIAHDLIFPVIVYGFVVLAWLVWMKFFVLPNKK